MKRLLDWFAAWRSREHRRTVLEPYWRHLVDTFPDDWRLTVDEQGNVLGIESREPPPDVVVDDS